MSNVISIFTECLDIYSLALCDNKIRPVSLIKLRNVSDFNLKNLELELCSSPSFFSDYCDRIGELSSGRYIRLSDIELSIDATRLFYLSSPTTSTIKIRIKSQGEILAEENVQVQLLPYDYIPSFSTYPELCAAFVTPMQPEVRAIGDSLPAYIDDPKVPANMDMWNNSDRNTSLSVIRGIYKAVQDLRITYNISPLLIDTKHSKTRLPEALTSLKGGNTLEISLLFASICEYLGYNSFIAYDNGKAYAGAFFKDKTFGCPTLDDGRSFRDISDGITRDFCIIDPTSLVNGTHVSFEDSAKMAAKAFEDSEFPIIIDIKECRRAGILPIKNRIKKDGNLIFEEIALPGVKKDFVFPKNTFTLSSVIKNAIAPLNSSNPLVFLNTKSAVFLVGGAKSIIGKSLFNPYLTIKSFSFSGISLSNDEEIFQALVKLNSSVDLSDISNTVTALYEKKELEKRLIRLLDTKLSKSSLYISFGLVSGKISEKEICAPLFLSPATLNYDSSTASFYLSFSKNSVVLNKAVFEYLSDTVGFSLPFDPTFSDFIEEYDSIITELQKQASKFDTLSVVDTTTLTKAPLEEYLTTAFATDTYLGSSDIVTKLCNGNSFDSTPFEKVTSDELQPDFFNIPLVLDASQTNAYTAALSNSASLISGPSGSGKTRVAAAVAFSSLAKGERVLYVSSSDSNIHQFTKYAKEASFYDFLVNISKNNLHKNSFDLSSAPNTEVLEAEMTELKENITDKHSRLTNYYRALHRVREIGFSLYEAVSQYERYKTFPYAVNFTNSDVSNLSRDDVVRWFDVVSNLSKAGADCHEPFNNPLMYIKQTNFSYDLKSRSIIQLSRYQESVHRFIESQNKLAEYLSIEVPIIREIQTESLKKLTRLLIDNYNFIYPSVFVQKGFENDFITIESFIDTTKDFFETKEYLDSHFTSDVLSIDADQLYTEWRNAGLKFAIAKVTAQSSLRNKLKIYARDPKTVTVDNVAELLQKISNYKAALRRMAEISSITRRLFSLDLENEINKGNKEVFQDVECCIVSTRTFNQLILEIYGSEKTPDAVFRHNETLLSAKERFRNEITALFDDLNRLQSDMLESEGVIVSTLSLDLDKAKNDNAKIWYYFVEKFLERMSANIDLLKHWCCWNKEKETAQALGLSGVVSLYESEQMTYNDIKNAFLKGFFKTVSEYILSCEPDINNFSKELFETTQKSLIIDSNNWRKKQISQISNNILEMSKKRLKDEHDLSREEASLILKRDFLYNDKLFNTSEKSRKILSCFKPCVVSKETSVLSQLGTDIDFDTLIIDSADELKWEEVVLLLPMAKRVVIFCEDPEKDLLISAILSHNVTHVPLGWIYSYNFCSRLINKLFYPMSTSFVFPDGDRRGIRVIRQKGTYDRKNTRANLIEASAVVDEIMKIIESGFRYSFSVIAMTEEQATLIELLLTKRLQSLPESVRKAFFDRSEPFYISSLDKSQFNPCDTVIFSTTYSVEERPKYKDTFSRTIPELSTRRAKHNLISALSSARREFILATSLSEEMLAKFKTVIPTYSMFKNIVMHLSDVDAPFDSEMNKNPRVENSVIRQTINHIESLGYRADMDVGTNDCRVDIAVKRKNEDGYILGIIFDESAYMCGGDLISRCHIMNNLENNLLWKIIRIYTVEWFENSPKQLDLITKMLEDGNKSDSIISFDALV